MGFRGRFMRWIGLLAVGSIAVHELRYVVGPGAQAHGAAVSQMHSYFPLAITLAALVFIASLVQFVSTLLSVRTGRGFDGGRSRFPMAWPGATCVLVAVFVTQESLEGAVLGGHSAGFHGLFGHGGWTVGIVAPLLGALIAFLVRGSEKAIETVARRSARSPRRKPVRIIPPRPALAAPSRLHPLARNLAGRAPPLLGS